MSAYTCASISATKFQECAERSDTFLLGSNVGVCHGTFPQPGVADEGLEDGVMFVSGDGEGFCRVFIARFTDLPVLAGC